jgi:type II secretory pathway pseudopilin PulG
MKSRRLTSFVGGAAGQRGITVLEILILVVIVGVVAAVGVPVLHARSRAAVLDANMRSLASLVQEEALAGYRWDYVPDGGGNEEVYLSNHLEALLREAIGKTCYVNPFVSKTTSRTILNSTEIATNPETAPPAVFLTNSEECGYETFDAQPFDTARRFLTGTIVVHFDAQAYNVDVFFVDAAGNKSPRVIRVPMV